MYEQLIKNLGGYWSSIADGEHGTPLKKTIKEAINAIESLQAENSFLKEMQRQMAKNMGEQELGIMVGKALDGMGRKA